MEIIHHGAVKGTTGSCHQLLIDTEMIVVYSKALKQWVIH